MIAAAITRLEYLCHAIPTLLLAINEAEFGKKPAPNKWSKKETIGHLIDSATNNHQRFVRGQFEEAPTIGYDQDNWTAFSFYQQMPRKQIIEFWAAYNRQLAELMKRIPPENLQRECINKKGERQTLDFLINDYVAHLEHHLRQIVAY